jgi:uncharacterized protein YkwD
MLLVMALFSMPSCSPGVSQQEHDRVSNELSAIQSQLASLQGKLAETESLQGEYEELSKQHVMVKSELETMQSEYEELINQYEELNNQYDPIKSELETIQSEYEELINRYEELNNQYEELSEQYAVVTKEPAEINEEDVEQAIFNLINQERGDNGIDELMWGRYRYKDAIAHSRYMATKKKLEYPEYGWQEIFWATGYSTADEIANAALTVWKNRLLYEITFLNRITYYGAVAVYKSGEIFYITYTADYFQ